MPVTRIAVDSFASAAPATFHPECPHEAVPNTLAGSGVFSGAQSEYCQESKASDVLKIRPFWPTLLRPCAFLHIYPGVEGDGWLRPVDAFLSPSSASSRHRPRLSAWAGSPALRVMPRQLQATKDSGSRCEFLGAFCPHRRREAPTGVRPQASGKDLSTIISWRKPNAWIDSKPKHATDFLVQTYFLSPCAWVMLTRNAHLRTQIIIPTGHFCDEARLVQWSLDK